MGRILGMGAAVELAAVPGVDEELEGITQGENRAGEATRATAQSGEGVPQFDIVRLDGIGLTLVGQRLMVARTIDKL